MSAVLEHGRLHNVWWEEIPVVDDKVIDKSKQNAVRLSAWQIYVGSDLPH